MKAVLTYVLGFVSLVFMGFCVLTWPLWVAS